MSGAVHTRRAGRRSLPALALATTVLLLAGCEEQQQVAAEAAPPPPAVGVTEAAREDVRRAFEFVGRIEAVDTVDLRARVEGFLQSRFFREGDEVFPGQLLFAIEKDSYEAEVERLKAAVARAEADLLNAEQQLRRGQELLQNKNIPEAEVDERSAAVAMAKADVLAQQAALRQAEIDLGYTDIRAPIAGKIGTTPFTEGDLVGPDSGPLATIVSQDPIYVTFPVSYGQLRTIREWRGQGDAEVDDDSLRNIEFGLELPGGQSYPQAGRWNFTGSQVDEGTDTVSMRAVFPNPERVLIDGQFANVVLRAQEAQPSLVVPLAALQTDQAGRYVLVVDGENKVEQRRVTTGPEQGTEIVIQAGLEPDERVIVEGLQKVRPGQVVAPSQAAAPEEPVDASDQPAAGGASSQ
jgi:membrane fusion protein (multidrug efflux system)